MVWVGVGEAPTSHGTFEPFSLAEMGHAERAGSFDVAPPKSEPGRQAFELFRQGYIAYTDESESR